LQGSLNSLSWGYALKTAHDNGQVETTNVSPKLSSLAFDEVQEQTHQNEVVFEPELNLLVKGRNGMFMSSSSEIVRIGGRVTVSF
jgi:hypothetical protein